MVKAAKQRGNLKAKTFKGLLSTLMLAGGSQVMRFASNLILTRLLFPEAFGLMALVQVIITGLQMLSNFGLRASVMQSARGDDPAFLNTAWVMQIIRGLFLWVVVFLLTPTIARLYGQPELLQILPIAGLNIVILGFQTTKALTAQRHMNLGKLSALKLVAQAINLIVIIILSYLWESVWALVAGLIVSPLALVLLLSFYLPGQRNRFQFEKASALEILSFGKFLFLSSFATYVVSQGDRAILGFLIPIDLLGIYGIGFALAALPLTVITAVTGSVIFPLYRMRHPSENAANRANIFKVRRLVAGAGVAVVSTMAFAAPWLVDFLYDDRYALAGPITMFLCVANVPMVVFSGTMNAALVKGDAYRFMVMNVVTAFLQLVLLWIMASAFGIFGAAVAIGLSPLLTYPLLAHYLKRYGNWDFKGDLFLIICGMGATIAACWLHWDKAAALF